MTIIEKQTPTQIVEKEKLKEPTLYCLEVVSITNYVCTSTLLDSITNCLNTDLLIIPISAIHNKLQKTKSCILTTSMTKEVAESYVVKLNTYLNNFTNNGICSCGTHIKYRMEQA